MIFFTFLRIRSFLLIFFSICATQVFSQAVGDFRSAQTGNWNTASTWERYDGASWVALSAFPVVGSTNSSSQSVASTTHVVALPSGIQRGDLLLIFWVDASTSNTNPTVPANWTEIDNSDVGSRYRAVWYKIADGTEGATINVTGGNEKSAHNSYRIVSGTYSGVPVSATPATGNTNAANPPSTTSGFGAVNTLWIASAHSAGDATALTNPTNYTNQVSGYSGTAGDVDSRMVTARRSLNAASENPGAFSNYSATRQWAAFTVAIAPLTFPTNTNNVITVRNTHIVTATASVSVDEVTIDAGGQVTINTGQTLTVANGAGTDLTVNGTVVNTGTITTTGTVAFNAASLYTHNQNGGTIPTATWNTSSTCNVTGITGTAPSGLSQSFGNFTWNCNGQTTGFLFAEALTTINGTFTIGLTNAFGLFLSSTNNATYTLNIGGDLIINDNGWLSLIYGQNNNSFGDNIVGTINVGGNFTQSAGFFDFYPFIATGNNLSLNKNKLNVTGDFSQSGGQLDFCGGSSNTTNFTELNVTGNFSQSGTGFIITSTGSTLVKDGTITFNKTGLQTVYSETPANLSYANFIVASTSTTQMLSDIMLYSNGTANFAGNFTVNGILDAGTNKILSSTGAVAGLNNSFTLNSGAGLITANTNGVQNANIGTVSTSLATRTFSSLANYTFNGTAIQNSGIFTTTPTANQVNNLTMNNTAGNTTTGLTLEQPIAVAGVLTLTSGHITTTSNLLTLNAGSSVNGANYAARTSGGSANSFINGPLKKIGGTNFLFPVGKVNRGIRFCGVSGTGTATDTFTGEFISGSASNMAGGITASGLIRVSKCEYWTIATTAGSPSVNVTLSWNPASICNAAAYVTQLSSLVVAHYGTSWDDYGGSADAGSNVSTGSITWSGVTTFSPFSLGSTSESENPLPVKLVDVKAYNTGNRNRIEWTNLTEIDVVAYEVERSLNGTQFTSMASLAARSNTNDKESYYEYDVQAAPVTYYRIKVTSRDGKIIYSPIVKVATDLTVKQDIVLYPNPVTGKQFTMQMNSAAGNYFVKIYAANGQIVKTETLTHPGGSYAKTIELPGQLQAGQYYMQVSGGEKILTSKFIVQ